MVVFNKIQNKFFFSQRTFSLYAGEVCLTRKPCQLAAGVCRPVPRLSAGFFPVLCLRIPVLGVKLSKPCLQNANKSSVSMRRRILVHHRLDQQYSPIFRTVCRTRKPSDGVRCFKCFSQASLVGIPFCPALISSFRFLMVHSCVHSLV